MYDSRTVPKKQGVIGMGRSGEGIYQEKGEREELPWRADDPPYLALRRGDSPTVAPAGHLGHPACPLHRLFANGGQAGLLF